MKTIFIYYKYPFFIEGSYFQEFIHKFASRADKISLVATRYPKGQNDEKNSSITYSWVPLLNIEIFGEFFFILCALIRVIFTKSLHDADVTNTVGPRGLLAGWYLKKRYGIPLVCTIELLNERGSLINNLYYWLVKLMITRIPVDKFICWSSYYWEKHLSEWGIPQSKVEVIPGGIAVDEYRSLHDPEQSAQIKERYAPTGKLIVFAKPLLTQNAESAKLLVRSVALLPPTEHVKLLLGGGRREHEVREVVDQLGVRHLVDFMPPTSFKKIANYIGAADLVVLPYMFAHTTSRGLAEAMALGKPIIATPAGEVGRMLTDRENVLFVDPTPASISTAILTLLGNRELAELIGKNALQLVRDKYHLENTIARTKRTLAEVVDRSSRRRCQ